MGIGWNEVEYVGLNEEFRNGGKRQSEQVDLMRRLWSETRWTTNMEFHRIDKAGIKPRPADIPICHGSAPALPIVAQDWATPNPLNGGKQKARFH